MSSSTFSIGIIFFKSDGLCIISSEKSIKILSFSLKFPTKCLLNFITCPFVFNFSAKSLAKDLIYVPFPLVTSNSAESIFIIFLKLNS